MHTVSRCRRTNSTARWARRPYVARGYGTVPVGGSARMVGMALIVGVEVKLTNLDTVHDQLTAPLVWTRLDGWIPLEVEAFPSVM